MIAYEEVLIGKGTKIWHPDLVNIYGNCVIGDECNIGAFVEIGPGVKIGNGVRIGAHCFIGPGCVFTNDRYPPGSRDNWEKTTIKKGASLGAGCVILPGVIVGAKVSVGAGTVIAKDVPDGWRVIGNPMKRIGVSVEEVGFTKGRKNDPVDKTIL